MAIAFDAKSILNNDVGTTHTVAHTCTGTNLLLVVVMRNNDGNGDLITGVTYNSVSMTLLFKQNSSAALWDYFFYLLAPSTGTHNIVATASSSNTIYLRGASYSGVSQTGFPDASSHTTGTGTTATGTVTTVADNCWIVGLLEENSTNTVTPGANTTIRNATEQSVSGVDSNGPFTPAGSHSVSMSWTGSGNIGVQVASIAPAVVATANANFLSFM